MSHIKDTDYLGISTRIHAMENRMLTRERMDRMIEARDDAEALKVLSECGYAGGDHRGPKPGAGVGRGAGFRLSGDPYCSA